ncbi:MAG: efflux RND transporter periplasmic adaptor subunit [Terrimicrobiaceae bacterium]|nr:efflux RND transporter periplasmic adaptor subunit [Terrimicrobiaceae bacterium]
MMVTNEKRAEPALPPAAPDSPIAPPSEKRFRAGRWILLLLAIAGTFSVWKAFTLSVAGAKAHGLRADDDATRPIPVVAGAAEQRDFPIYLQALGTAQAFNSVTVRARVDGEIQQILFREGQEVKKGDQLAQIDPRTYQSQYDQAAAKKAQDEAQLANARLMLARNDTLMKSRVIDQQTYDTQKFSVAQLAALVNADQAAINNAQTQLDYTRLLSPISGRAGIRLVDEGNIVRAGDATGIVVINQVQPISVVFTLPQQQLAPVRDALLQKQTLKVIAVDRDNLTTLSEGELTVMDNQIDSTTATVKLKATFANEDLRLWPGQFVNVRLLLGIRKAAVCVPTAAIQRGPDGAFVYVIQPDSTVKMAVVQPGDSDGDWTLIEQGLSAGNRVVVDGQYRLKPDSTVTLGAGPSRKSGRDAKSP